MRSIVQIRVLAGLAALGFALAACGNSPSASTSPASTASPASTGAGATRTVVDTLGHSVRIPANVTRVATNLPLIPPMIDALGGTSKLVYRPTGKLTPLMEKVDPSLRNVASAPVDSLNAESLLNLHPQVFIMTSLTAGLLPQLTRLGIPVVQIATPSTPAQIEATMTLVARVLGGAAPARANAFASFYNGNVAALASATSGTSSGQQPTVYYGPGPGATTTVGNGNIITTSIEQAGGVNVAAQHGIGASQAGSFAFPTITAETLLSWDPGYIIGISSQVASAFTSSPQFATLSAVRDHHVYVCPAGIFAWCASGPETALQPLFVASVIHPGLISAAELTAKVKSFYAEFFGYKLSSSAATELLAGKD